MHSEEDWKPVGSHQQIRIGSLLSKGSACVFEGKWKKNSVAVKKMICDAEPPEVGIIEKLKDHNIVQMLYKDWNESEFYIAMELCQYNLRQYVDERYVKNEICLTRVQVLEQVTDGLNYLHGGKTYYTVHRDLKPTNILFKYVERDHKWVVKISDFGISKEVEFGITSTSADMAGSSGFIAPELLPLDDGSPGPGKIRKEVDIFSLGVVFYIVLSCTGSHPFSDDMNDVDKRVRNCNPNLSGLRAEFKEAEPLILSLLKKDYTERPNISDVKSHFIFWNDEKKLDFLCDVSNLLEGIQKPDRFLEKLEQRKTEIFCNSWKEALIEGNPAVQETLERRGEKDYSSLQDLLRQIRNWRVHHAQGRPKFRVEIGDIPSQFLAFFTIRFPKLISFSYEFMTNFNDGRFRELYYGCSAKEESNEIPYTSAVTETNNAVNQSGTGDAQFPELGLNFEFNKPRVSTHLAQQAINGRNSLIITTSDSDKADLCWEIIKSHVQQPGSRSVISLGIDNARVRKQYRYLQPKLCNLERPVHDVISMTNASVTDLPVGLAIKRMKVTVVTPAVLVYELTKESPHLSFHDISLLIFDDCYNAMDRLIQHSYKSILDAMLRFLIRNPQSHSIQLLGITSSCDIGSNTDEMADLLSLMATLNATSVSTHPSLAVTEMIAEDNLIIVDSVTDELTTKLLGTIHMLETKLKERGIFGQNNSQVLPPPDQKALVKYKGWIDDVARYAVTNVSVRHEAEPIARSLEISHDLLNLKNVIPIPLEAYKDIAPDVYGALKQISSTEVALMKKLYEILNTQFTNGSGNSRNRRCIIIVENSWISQAIYDELYKNWVLSQSNRHVAELGRQNSRQLYSVNVDDDKHKTHFWIYILIGPSEEGFDVSRVDIVILYENSEAVSCVTRAGRGWVDRVQIVCLMSREQDLRTKHLCEFSAKSAIHSVTSLSTQARISTIDDVRAKQRTKMVEQIGKELWNQKEAAGWKVLCGSCNGYLTRASRIKCINNDRHVVDENFDNIVSCVASPANHIELELELELTCNVNCRKRIGIKKKIHDVFYFIIDPHAVILKNDEGETLSCRQWEECPFLVSTENTANPMQIDVSKEEQIDGLLAAHSRSQEQMVDPAPASEVLSDILRELGDQITISQTYRRICNAVLGVLVKEFVIHLIEFI